MRSSETFWAEPLQHHRHRKQISTSSFPARIKLSASGHSRSASQRQPWKALGPSCFWGSPNTAAYSCNVCASVLDSCCDELITHHNRPVRAQESAVSVEGKTHLVSVALLRQQTLLLVVL